ncbi:MAG: hypothetical protein Roseis2KO_24270 [Roseivirga sp.]
MEGIKVETTRFCYDTTLEKKGIHFLSKIHKKTTFSFKSSIRFFISGRVICSLNINIMKNKNLIFSFLIVLGVFFTMSLAVTAQTIEEDDCDIRVFTGVKTFPPGSSDPFDWECHGEGLSCTEVYIIC